MPAVQALYRFARAADDIADEGNAAHSERLAQLDDLAAQLTSPSLASSALVQDLAPFIAQGKLPSVYLLKLLSAFRQDVVQDASSHPIRYATMDELLDYCSRSANPVGRLMLHCVGAPCSPESFAASDAICTSLQLINFWQDLAKDAQAGRVYVPHDLWVQHGSPHSGSNRDPNRDPDSSLDSSPDSSLDNSPNRSAHAGYHPMMAALCTDARARMLAGAPLIAMLSGRFKIEILLTMAGGLRILDKLATVEYDVLHRRPRLAWQDALPCLRIVWALCRGRLK